MTIDQDQKIALDMAIWAGARDLSAEVADRARVRAADAEQRIEEIKEWRRKRKPKRRLTIADFLREDRDQYDEWETT
jgi:hypothetical protein